MNKKSLRDVPSQREKATTKKTSSIPGYTMRPMLSIEAPAAPAAIESGVNENKAIQTAEAAERAAEERVRAIKASLQRSSQPYPANFY